MSIFDRFIGPAEGVLEIEESYIRVFCPSGTSWKTETIALAGKELFDTLRREVPRLMGPIRQISVVLHVQAGNKVLPFPIAMGQPEILEHLEIKREDYFSSNAELAFATRQLAGNDPRNREYLVSYVNKALLHRMTETLSEIGFSVNRVCTALEAMIGAHLHQTQGAGEGPVCLLMLGYSTVNMVVAKGPDIVAVRTSLTGSIKELEMRLMTALKLKQEQVEACLANTGVELDPHTVEIIQQNERELLARITPFFAYIRSLGQDAGSQNIQLVFPYLDIPSMRGMLEQTFRTTAHTLVGGRETEPSRLKELAQVGWLRGVIGEEAISLVPPRAPFFRFALTPRLAAMFVIFFLFAPLGILRLNKALIQQHAESLKLKNEDVRPLIEQAKLNQGMVSELAQKTAVISRELANRPVAAAVFGNLVNSLQGDLRLEKIQMIPLTGQLTVTGLAIDTETGLRYWDAVQKIQGFKDVKIAFPDGSRDGAQGFSITATVGN